MSAANAHTHSRYRDFSRAKEKITKATAQSSGLNFELCDLTGDQQKQQNEKRQEK